MFYEVIHDSGETANKCTIAPLSGRKDFRIFPVKGKRKTFGPLEATFLLHHEGKCLSQVREEFRSQKIDVKGIAVIDCIWRRLTPLLNRVEKPWPQWVKIPEGFVTAYPRRGVKNPDPEGGLATIEAIFLASALLGHWDETLMSRYYFGRKFIDLNRDRLLEMGVSEASDPLRLPRYEAEARSAMQRRRDRGQK